MVRSTIKLSYNTSKFGSHGHSDSGDMVFLVCHMISQDHVTSLESNPVDVRPAKFGNHRKIRNIDINSYIKSYMETLENAELTTLILHNARFFKSRIPIYKSEVPDTAGRKTRRRRRRTQASQSVWRFTQTQ